MLRSNSPSVRSFVPHPLPAHVNKYITSLAPLLFSFSERPPPLSRLVPFCRGNGVSFGSSSVRLDAMFLRFYKVVRIRKLSRGCFCLAPHQVESIAYRAPYGWPPQFP